MADFQLPSFEAGGAAHDVAVTGKIQADLDRLTTDLGRICPDGPAERAGLAAGDIVVAIEGLRASASAIEKLLRRRRVGETLTVHAFRRDELIAAF